MASKSGASSNSSGLDAELMEDEVALNYNGIYTLFGQINNESVAPACHWILKNTLKREPLPEMKLILNSEGGDLVSAFALIDCINGSKTPIGTIGLGEVLSAGLMVFISGKKGKRILTPNCLVMSHQFTWNVEGKEHELLASRKGHDITSEMVIRHYMKHTGLTHKKISDILLPAGDIFLTAKEALKYGLCDEVRELNSK